MPGLPQRGRPSGHRKGGFCPSNWPIKGISHKLLSTQGPLALKKINYPLNVHSATFWASSHTGSSIPPRRNDSHPDSYWYLTLCVQTRWFGSILIDSYQLIESVTAHLPGHLWWYLQTALHNQDLLEIRWISELLPSNCNPSTVGKEGSGLIFLCAGEKVFVKQRTSVGLGLNHFHFS